MTETFPEEVRFVLETLREVYGTEARIQAEGLDPEPRLLRHQAESAPRMAALERWMRAQFEERRIEPNSTLGAGIRYMQKRWLEPPFAPAADEGLGAAVRAQEESGGRCQAALPEPES